MISYSDFEKVDIRVGTVIEAKLNQKSNKPSLYLVIDFGNVIGKKKSSAQLTKHYLPDELIDKQVAAVINITVTFKPPCDDFWKFNSPLFNFINF